MTNPEAEPVAPGPSRPVTAGPVTVIVPVFNERQAVGPTLEALAELLDRDPRPHRVVVVDDGSTDGTAEILRELAPRLGLTVLSHTRNLGYGAALKTGVRASETELVAITDADGTYPNDRILELAGLLEDADMVVGARTGADVRIPMIRRPAKWLVGKLANVLTGCRIPDLNSGLRVFRLSALRKYVGILPDGFSFTTTITLAMLSRGHDVRFVPIDYRSRIGSSKIRPVRDTLNFIQLILRTTLLFDPLRIFLPVALAGMLGAVAVLLYSWLFTPKIMDATVAVLFIGSIQILAVGALADIINRRMPR